MSIMKHYRITPLRGKWIVQRITDRKQVGKPFKHKAEAEAYELKLSTDLIPNLSVRDINILLSDLKSFYKKLYKLKKTMMSRSQ